MQQVRSGAGPQLIRGSYRFRESAQRIDRARIRFKDFWRRGADSNRRIKVLQTSPLTTWVPRLGFDPSGQRHSAASPTRKILERETGFEPATSTLARSHSTAELLPRISQSI